MTENQIIAHSPLFKGVLENARRAAQSSANILISGESGTGKEVVARYIHSCSQRQKFAFVAVNCSAIPEQLLEAELFGHSRGAFTGAVASHMGLFEEAHGGTIFLDEIGDMDLHLQAKLLRVLQEKNIKRVGENHYRPLDIRIIAASHMDLAEAVERKSFREDLFFRLNVVPLEIPPLRERKEDIAPLARHFLSKYTKKHSLPQKQFSEEVLPQLLTNFWAGNVRELENVIERAVVMSSGSLISVRDIQEPRRQHSPEFSVKQSFATLHQKEGRLFSLEELCQHYIQYALEINQGAREKTAKDLGIDRKTLYRKIHDPR